MWIHLPRLRVVGVGKSEPDGRRGSHGGIERNKGRGPRGRSRRASVILQAVSEMRHSTLDRDVIAEFCQRHRVRRLALFGSVLHGDDRPDSDLDLLVEFEPAVQIGFIGLAAMQIELSNLLGRSVDLRTANELSRYFRDRVLAEAEVQYARG